MSFLYSDKESGQYAKQLLMPNKISISVCQKYDIKKIVIIFK